MTRPTRIENSRRGRYRLGLHGCVACLLGLCLVVGPGIGPATAASALGQESGVGELLAGIVFGLLGYLSALVLHSVVKVLTAGLLILAVVLLAGVMGVTVLQPAHFWRQLLEVLPLFSAIGERLSGVLALQGTPVLATVYLVGLGAGLLRLRRLV